MEFLMIFILPAAIGLALRLLGNGRRNGHLVTLCLAALAVGAWARAYLVFSHGGEAAYTTACQLTCGALGALLAEAILRLHK